jgi:hypothetical protein
VGDDDDFVSFSQSLPNLLDKLGDGNQLGAPQIDKLGL